MQSDKIAFMRGPCWNSSIEDGKRERVFLSPPSTPCIPPIVGRARRPRERPLLSTSLLSSGVSREPGEEASALCPAVRRRSSPSSITSQLHPISTEPFWLPDLVHQSPARSSATSFTFRLSLHSEPTFTTIFPPITE